MGNSDFMQEYPLINDEARVNNSEILFNKLMQDLKKIDKTGKGWVSEDKLLRYLQSRLPSNKKLNIILFKQLLENIGRDRDKYLDLKAICKKYIETHEEIILNLDTLKKCYDKEKNLKKELESKIQKAKNEKLYKNGISTNACVSTEIGKITLLNKIGADQIYCSVRLDENEEKRTLAKYIEEANFTEKFTFPIEDKLPTLSYRFFIANTNKFIGETDVPLYIINLENEEVSPYFEIKDDNDLTIGVFKPKIIIVTSYYDMYQKQIDNIDKNIESYQNRINQFSETIDDLSLPYKSELEKIKLKGNKIKINDRESVKKVEEVSKYTLKDKQNK